PEVLPGLEKAFERDKGNPKWKVQERLEHELPFLKASDPFWFVPLKFRRPAADEGCARPPAHPPPRQRRRCGPLRAPLCKKPRRAPECGGVFAARRLRPTS